MGCTARDVSHVIIQPCEITAIDKIQDSKQSVYPNPATDILHINLNQIITGTISISDVHGNTLISHAISDDQFDIASNDLSNGLYILKIASDKININRQISIIK